MSEREIAVRLERRADTAPEMNNRALVRAAINRRITNTNNR